MEIETYSIGLLTKGNCDIVDITDKVSDLVVNNNFVEGNVLLFAGGSTATGITSIEYEPGLLERSPEIFR